jgi:Uma2 family endonuclease
MSTTTFLPPSAPPPDPLWRLSVDQYHQMIQAGILSSDDPVELLDGCLVRKMPKNPLHCYVSELLRERLAGLLPAGYFTSSQNPVTLTASEPEPDVLLIRGARADFVARHPHPSDIVLLVEVADTSLTRDRGAKKRIYAQAGIANYWVINLVNKQIEVYQEPAGIDYGKQAISGPNEDVAIIVDGKALGSVRLAQLLPAQET